MAEYASIKLMIVDDRVVVREGIKGIIAATPDIAVVGEASSGLDAVRLS